ncbi:MAG: hypothetical protein ACI9JM_000852 [Halioglobus sp.]|jgi:hypothetical protein
MNKMMSRFMLSAVLLFGSGSLAAYEIVGGALDQTDVGLEDFFTDWQSGPFTGGGGNPSGEESWINSILDPDTSFSVKTASVQMFETDGAGIRAFELGGSPAYFLVKNATFRALFENNSNSSYGVIDVAFLEGLGGFNLSGAGQLVISHVSEFGTFTGPDPDPDPDPDPNPNPNPVPVPGTLLLLSVGLLILRRTAQA